MANKYTQITAATHLTTKLTPHNYPVWRRQVEATLISLELEDFIIGSSDPPPKEVKDKDGKSTSNPEYLLWSGIISLKSKLTKNPKGNHSVTEFLQEMRSIADDLALAQSPVSEEDLMVYILSQLGIEYNTIAAAIKVRENPLSYSELFDKLTDYERALKESSTMIESTPLTANYTSRQHGSNYRNSASRNNNNRPHNSGSQRHLTRDCRKLARFLRENNVINDKNTAPVANVTTSAPASPSWLVDTCASNHVTSDKHTLHQVSEYGGPDEIVLGDGTGLPISNIGNTYINTSHKPLLLSKVLHVPRLRKNLVSVSQLCDTNRVSVEFFPSHFL
ncbi:hypothetical protein LXL04_036754 [Taraxacum kok-saghyz]